MASSAFITNISLIILKKLYQNSRWHCGCVYHVISILIFSFLFKFSDAGWILRPAKWKALKHANQLRYPSYQLDQARVQAKAMWKRVINQAKLPKPSGPEPFRALAHRAGVKPESVSKTGRTLISVVVDGAQGGGKRGTENQIFSTRRGEKQESRLLQLVNRQLSNTYCGVSSRNFDTDITLIHAFKLGMPNEKFLWNALKRAERSNKVLQEERNSVIKGRGKDTMVSMQAMYKQILAFIIK